jgi:hypothetical protein
MSPERSVTHVSERTVYGPIHTQHTPEDVYAGGDVFNEGDRLYEFWCVACDAGVEPPYYVFPKAKVPKKPPGKSPGNTTTDNPEGGTKTR